MAKFITKRVAAMRKALQAADTTLESIEVESNDPILQDIEFLGLLETLLTAQVNAIAMLVRLSFAHLTTNGNGNGNSGSKRGAETGEHGAIPQIEHPAPHRQG
jgi:hypothetical protein